jgi:hypothetical protein
MEYKILIKGEYYEIYFHRSLVMTAKRKGRIWGEKIIFCDTNGDVFAVAKIFILIILTIKREIFFYHKWGNVRIVHKLKYQLLQIGGNELKIQHPIFGENTNLFIDGVEVGYTKGIKSSLYNYEDLIVCKDENFALIFAMVHIINGKFNIA